VTNVESGTPRSMEAAVELIAVNAVAIEIGAAFLVAIAVAAVAFWAHTRVLEHEVERRRAELRAQWAHPVVSAPFMADRARRPQLEIVPDHQAKQASASEDEGDEAAVPRRAVG